jgi:hypothetical protein
MLDAKVVTECGRYRIVEVEGRPMLTCPHCWNVRYEDSFATNDEIVSWYRDCASNSKNQVE